MLQPTRAKDHDQPSSGEGSGTHFTDRYKGFIHYQHISYIWHLHVYFKNSQPSPAMSYQTNNAVVVHISQTNNPAPVLPTDHWHVCFKSSPPCQFQTKQVLQCSSGRPTLPPAPPWAVRGTRYCTSRWPELGGICQWMYSLQGQIHFLAICFLKNSMTSGDCKICWKTLTSH